MGKNIDDIIDFQLDLQPDPAVDDLLRRELTKDTYHVDSKLNKDRIEKEKSGVKHGDYKYKDPLEYTPEEFKEFKKKLGVMLCNDGITCTDTFFSSTYKNYISNYVDVNFFKNKDLNVLNRLKFRLEYMDVGSYLTDGSKKEERFPVVTEWKGHFLVRVTYFRKTVLGVEAKTIPVKEKSIVIA